MPAHVNLSRKRFCRIQDGLSPGMLKNLRWSARLALCRVALKAKQPTGVQRLGNQSGTVALNHGFRRIRGRPIFGFTLHLIEPDRLPVEARLNERSKRDPSPVQELDAVHSKCIETSASA
jgi:hypothetical protein